MLTLFTGMPGAGKTAALVDLLRKLDGSRPLYADGLNGLKLDHQPVDATKWHEEVPDGAILVIDEVQRIWRPRGPGAKVPDAVQMLETHRHRGIDIYVTTQNPRLLDANVRGLVGRHVHIRDTGWLGRHWYEWPECNDAMNWKTCPVKMKYKLPKAAFDLYKSASEHTKPVRRTPPALYLSIAAILAAVVGVVMVMRTLAGKAGGDEKPVVASSIEGKRDASSILGGSAAGPGPGLRVVDDRVDWIPRVSFRPESAPAYDDVRKVSAMPIITGCVQSGGRAKCFTQQGTDAGLTDQEAAAWLREGGRFNPYAVEMRGQGVERTTSQNAPDMPESSPMLIVLDGPGARDPLRQQPTSRIGGAGTGQQR